MVDKLIKDYKSGDTVIRDLLNYWTVYITPSLNPDGKKI
jgi:murein tripeptide amidase MpaA